MGWVRAIVSHQGRWILEGRGRETQASVSWEVVEYLHLCEGCRENYFSHTFQISVLEAKGQLIIWTMAILL
jgi:hypothetical protein